eukprot:Gb_35768 [translate_table: standard]
MATRRALWKACEGQLLGLCKNRGNSLQAARVSQSIGHLGDSHPSLGLQSFVQKRVPWFLHRRELFQVSQSQVHPAVLYGDKMRDQLQKMNADSEDRLRLQNVHPPKGQLSLEEARKLLRLVQFEALKTRLHGIPNMCISHKELLEICMGFIDNSSVEEAKDMAKLLDQSGQILVLRHNVYLHPHQVARAIENVMPLSLPPQDDSRREELEKMEKVKAEIDREAKTHVRVELWSGLGFFILQTAGFMRLTFWELSWDVMEPICFYATSLYFIAGYAFFLRTSSDPTFEGFFKARFKSRQSRLMKKKNFDIERFAELQLTSKRGLRSSPSKGISLHDLED